MDINTKFNVGDVVYEIAFTAKEIEEKCLACNGEKTILLPNGKKYGCPACYGDGKKVVRTEKKWYILDGDEYYSRPIGEIRVEVKGKDVEINYLRKKTGSLIKEERCFKTKEEAQAECDRLNNIV